MSDLDDAQKTGDETNDPPALTKRDSPIRESRRLAQVLVFVPSVLLVAFDVARRHAVLGSYSPRDLLAYAGSILLSTVLIAGLVSRASIRNGGIATYGAHAALTLLALLAIGGQIYSFDRYGCYLHHRSVIFGTSMLPSVGQQLWSDRLCFAKALFPPALIAIAWPLVVKKVVDVESAIARAGVDAALASLLFIVIAYMPGGRGEQGATPDVLYMHAMGRLADAHWSNSAEVLAHLHPEARTPDPVPRVESQKRGGVTPNVLMIVTESVRASEVCVSYEERCPVTPFTNSAAKGRFGFSQVRALDSTTAVSLPVLWAGLPATASRREFHSAPLLWEYAYAAGYSTGYWSAQHMFFANAGVWLDSVPLHKRITATEIDPDATFETGADDARVIDRALADLASMREPFVGVVHLSNTHFPYAIDPKDAPFQPQRAAFGRGDAIEVRNRYRNSIYRQDKHVARLVSTLRARDVGARTAIVFASDHGEQIRELGAIGHTFSVYDFEVRVPLWIDIPAPLIRDEEAASMRALEKKPLALVDVMPTMLDIMGLLDAPPLSRFISRMPGRSLLRGGPPDERPLVLTNCTEIFGCASRNWGAMRGSRKLLASETDETWRCFDVANDPAETHDLGPGACSDLRAIAEADGRGTPF